ncbi:PI-actitoxin-Afv2a-like [Condylostylus longicornis]|uniref:PI-actitoxin-Afv2a-like n=1 Tax=Condylostylus longicornis TaxID=2530218 RepID=UPI00244E0E81|nr:PI-actitoxin-Afv2a-like [Condylostylus longicornis]
MNLIGNGYPLPVDYYDDLANNMAELFDDISFDESYARDVKNDSYERCKLPMRKGVCRAIMPRWSYDPIAKKCREFMFGGCGGNANNFLTESQCYQACKGV